jgi:hypothetical protein
VTKPKAKRKGIVVTVVRCTGGCDWSQNLCRVGSHNTALVCHRWLVRAGMKPLKPGELRKVRVTVEDVT